VSIQRRRYSQEFGEQLVEEVIRFSKPMTQVAREYGMSPQSLRNWVHKHHATHDTDHADAGADAKKTGREQQQVAELQEFTAEVAFLKQRPGTSRGIPVVAKYEFIDSCIGADTPYWLIVNMCAWCGGVSRSGF